VQGKASTYNISREMPGAARRLCGSPALLLPRFAESCIADNDPDQPRNIKHGFLTTYFAVLASSSSCMTCCRIANSGCISFLTCSSLQFCAFSRVKSQPGKENMIEGRRTSSSHLNVVAVISSVLRCVRCSTSSARCGVIGERTYIMRERT
jgi:hypothetical protein